MIPWIVVICLVVILLVNGLACKMMIDAAKDKGYYQSPADSDKVTLLWIIALLSPLGIVAVGLITTSLPDKRLQQSNDPTAAATAAADELPSI